MDKLMDLAVQTEASEVQLKAGIPPVVILSGQLRPLNLPPLKSEDILELLKQIAPEPRILELKDSGSCEFDFTFEGRAAYHVAARLAEGNCEFVLRLQWTNESSSALKNLPITEVDRRLSRRLDMPVKPYSSNLRLARSVGEFVSSLGIQNEILEREGRKFLVARHRVLDRRYERALTKEANLPAELCGFLLDVLEGKIPQA